MISYLIKMNTVMYLPHIIHYSKKYRGIIYYEKYYDGGGRRMAAGNNRNDGARVKLNRWNGKRKLYQKPGKVS